MNPRFDIGTPVNKQDKLGKSGKSGRSSKYSHRYSPSPYSPSRYSASPPPPKLLSPRDSVRMEPLQVTIPSDIKDYWYKGKAFTYAWIVILIVIGISLLSKWSENTKQYSKPFIRKVKSLIEQATRWNSMAQQDTNAVVQLIHCNYALSYAQIARSLVSDSDIETITGIDIHELIYYLEECQSYAVKNIGTNCPAIKIEGVFSAGSGWV